MDASENELSSLPATMAEIFLALVAVVIMMLLALLPAIRTPGALAPSPPFEVWNADLRIEGRSPIVAVADAQGLRLAAPDGRVVALDAILDDAPLAAGLGQAGKEGRDILLVIRPQGQEAAFLFSALAGSLDIGGVYQLRVDAGFDYIRDRGMLEPAPNPNGVRP
jgi:hypothetical protein